MNGPPFLRFAALAAGLALSAGTCLAASQTYTTTFTALNDSGVAGNASVTLDGSELTYTVHATGLEPNKFHQEHIHGFLKPNDRPSEIPVLSRDDLNKNGTIDDLEGDARMGFEQVFLTKSPDMENTYNDFPVADAKGNLNFTQTYDVSEQLPFLNPLNWRGVELHGMTEDGMYKADFPVAAGLLKAATTSGGGTGGSGGNAIPLPASVWSGGLLMGLVGASSLLKRRTRFA